MAKKPNVDTESEVRNILIEVAKKRKRITYMELTSRIRSRNFIPNSQDLRDLLTTISVKEESMGRGLLSAVVVQMGKDGMPGKGYFKWLGEPVPKKDRRKRWLNDLTKVFYHWAPRVHSSTCSPALSTRTIPSTSQRVFIH